MRQYLLGQCCIEVEALGNELSDALHVLGLLCGWVDAYAHVCHLYQDTAVFLIRKAQSTARVDRTLQAIVADWGELEYENVAAPKVIMDDVCFIMKVAERISYLHISMCVCI